MFTVAQVLSFPSQEAAAHATLIVDQAAAKLRAYLIEVGCAFGVVRRNVIFKSETV